MVCFAAYTINELDGRCNSEQAPTSVGALSEESFLLILAVCENKSGQHESDGPISNASLRLGLGDPRSAF